MYDGPQCEMRGIATDNQRANRSEIARLTENDWVNDCINFNKPITQSSARFENAFFRRCLHGARRCHQRSPMK